MTTIDNVSTGLKTIGYTVSLSPQEKIGNKEVVLTLEDLEIEVETSRSYFFKQTYALNWYSDNIVSIITAIPAIIIAVETATTGTCRDFRFETPDISREGTAYLITLKFSYIEMITTTVV